MKSGQSLIPIFHRYYVQELFALFFFSMKMSIPYIKLDSSLFVVVVPLCFIQSSDFKAFRVHFVNKRMLSPFLTIFFWARSTKHIIFFWARSTKHTIFFWARGTKHTIFFWAMSTKHTIFNCPDHLSCNCCCWYTKVTKNRFYFGKYFIQY